MKVYGPNVLKETDKERIIKVYTSRNEIIKYCKENKIRYEYMDNSLLNKMSKQNHQGVIIDVKEYDYYNLSDVTGNLVVALDHLEDPHNFGSIIRSCVAANVTSIIIPKDRCVKVTDTVIKVSVGMINHVKIIMVTNLNEALKKLQKQGYFVYAADMDGLDYEQIDYNDKSVLVIGNEGHGVSTIVKKTADELVSIQINPLCESLNASVAAGILLFKMK